MAHNIFFEEDLLMFFLDQKLLDDYKGIAIFNELFGRNKLSTMVLFNIIQSLAKKIK